MSGVTPFFIPQDGDDGLSAYEIAVAEGFVGGKETRNTRPA